MHLAGQRLRTLFGCDANGLAGFQVNKRGRHFSPVAEFQCALAKAASGDDGNRVSHATINLNVGNQAFAVCAAGIVDAEQFEPQHRHANAEDLPGAQVSVGFFSIA